MSKSVRASLRRSVSFALTSTISVAALGVLGVAPASAATIGETIASAARGETGNGPCAHGGYVGGPNQNSSCYNGRRTHAWCADFAGWAWAQAGVAGRGTLTDMANSFLDYGNKYGTRSNTPHVGDAVVYNMNDGTYINDHVAIVTAVSGDSVTITGGNESNSVKTNTTTNWRVGQSPFGQVITAYISPLGSGEEGTPETPAAPAVSSKVHLYGVGSDVRVYGNNADYSAGTWDGYNTVDGAQGFKQTTSIRGLRAERLERLPAGGRHRRIQEDHRHGDGQHRPAVRHRLGRPGLQQQRQLLHRLVELLLPRRHHLRVQAGRRDDDERGHGPAVRDRFGRPGLQQQ
ncbi:CHAP domain-containing protein, partial [Streptomyces sp. NRRL S-515]|uniref:CHAP domain-containing protein n=1 Tax=Streptomyces sp. NRRL S-515 TaxID=1463913 RepID=UPI00131C71EA